MPSNQHQIIEQAKFTYSPLEKAFKEQTKTSEDQGEKQINSLKSLESSDKQLPSIKDFISKERLNPEIVDETEKIEEEERLVEVKWFMKDLIKTMILEDLKKYMFLVMKLEIILLI